MIVEDKYISIIIIRYNGFLLYALSLLRYFNFFFPVSLFNFVALV